MGYVLPVLTEGATVGRWEAWDPRVDKVIRMVQDRWTPAEPAFPESLQADVDRALWLKRPKEAQGWTILEATHSPDYLPHTAAAAQAYDGMVQAALTHGRYSRWRYGKFPKDPAPEWVQLDNEHITDVAAMHAMLQEHGTGTETVRAVLSLWKIAVVTNKEQKQLRLLPRDFDFNLSSAEAYKYTAVTLLPPRREWRTGQLAVVPPVPPLATPVPPAAVRVLTGVANTNATVHAPPEPAEDGLSMEEVSHLLGEVLQRRGVEPVLAELVTLRQEVQELRKQFSFLSQALAAPPAPGPWARFLAWTGLFPSTKRARKITPETLRRIIEAEAHRLQQGSR